MTDRIMTEHRDPVLQSLFAADQADQIGQDAQAFTARVMAKTRRLRYWLAAILGGVALAFLAGVWLFGVPVQDIAQLLTQTLGATLFDLGEGWTSWVFAPVNNIASLLVLTAKAIRILRKKVLRASWSN